MSIWWSSNDKSKPNFIANDCNECKKLRMEITQLQSDNYELVSTIYKKDTHIIKLNSIIDKVVEICDKNIIK